MEQKERTIFSIWLRNATLAERTMLAQHCGTSVNYLYQLAGAHRINPSARLALAVVDCANAIRATRSPSKHASLDLPEVSIHDFVDPHFISRSK